MKDMNTELPENLATPNKDIQTIEREEISKTKKKDFPSITQED